MSIEREDFSIDLGTILKSCHEKKELRTVLSGSVDFRSFQNQKVKLFSHNQAGKVNNNMQWLEVKQ